MEASERVAALFLGEYLGGGVAREVYAYRPSPEEWVVKVQTDDSYEEQDYQNIAEWSLWLSADTKLREWLAPCIALSPCGGALMQVRAERCPLHLIPRRIPKVLGDAHQANFGIIGGRVVVTDYGRNFAYRLSANAKAMRKVSLIERTELSGGY